MVAQITMFTDHRGTASRTSKVIRSKNMERNSKIAETSGELKEDTIMEESRCVQACKSKAQNILLNANEAKVDIVASEHRHTVTEVQNAPTEVVRSYRFCEGSLMKLLGLLKLCPERFPYHKITAPIETYTLHLTDATKPREGIVTSIRSLYPTVWTTVEKPVTSTRTISPTIWKTKSRPKTSTKTIYPIVHTTLSKKPTTSTETTYSTIRTTLEIPVTTTLTSTTGEYVTYLTTETSLTQTVYDPVVSTTTVSLIETVTSTSTLTEAKRVSQTLLPADYIAFAVSHTQSSLSDSGPPSTASEYLGRGPDRYLLYLCDGLESKEKVWNAPLWLMVFVVCIICIVCISCLARLCWGASDGNDKGSHHHDDSAGHDSDDASNDGGDNGGEEIRDDDNNGDSDVVEGQSATGTVTQSGSSADTGKTISPSLEQDEDVLRNVALLIGEQYKQNEGFQHYAYDGPIFDEPAPQETASCRKGEYEAEPEMLLNEVKTRIDEVPEESRSSVTEHLEATKLEGLGDVTRLTGSPQRDLENPILGFGPSVPDLDEPADIVQGLRRGRDNEMAGVDRGINGEKDDNGSVANVERDAEGAWETDSENDEVNADGRTRRDVEKRKRDLEVVMTQTTREQAIEGR